MALPNMGGHTDGGYVTEGQDDKEDTSNALDGLLDNAQNQPTALDVTAGGTFNLNTPQANLDQYLESSLVRITGSPAGAVTVKVPDGNKRIAFENACGQTATVDTVTGATPVVTISAGATKTLQVRGIEITITADDATQTGAMLRDGSTPATGDHDWADQELQRPLLTDYAEALDSPAAAATVDLDLELGNVFDVTRDQNTTFTFSNPPVRDSGDRLTLEDGSGILLLETGDALLLEFRVAGSFTLVLRQDGTGGWTTTWPASVAWEAGLPPTLSTDPNLVDMLSFLTVDGGTTWFGFMGGVNFA